MVFPQDRRTPLHKAAYNGHLEVVKVLLQQATHISVNVKDSVSVANNRAVLRNYTIYMYYYTMSILACQGLWINCAHTALHKQFTKFLHSMVTHLFMMLSVVATLM